MINISDRLQVNKLIKYFLPKWFLARTNKNICHITYDGTYFPGQFLLPFCRAMPCNRGLCRYTVSVCLSVCHVRELSKWINISSIFYTILVFFHTKPHVNIPMGTPLTGASNAGGAGDSQPKIWLHRVLWTVWPPNAIHSAATNRGKLLTPVAGKRRRLLMAGDDDEVFMTRNQSTLHRRLYRAAFNCMQWWIW